MNTEHRPRLNAGQNRIAMATKGERAVKSYIGLGCVHVPFQNIEIMNGIYQLMESYKFDGFVLGGDFLDMNALSDYEKGKISRTGITLEEEYNAGNEVLDILDSLVDCNAEKVYLFGNHENRYWRWKADINNSKYGDLADPVKALNLYDRGYIVYTSYEDDYHQLGSLQVMHGEYHNIHSAKKHLDTFRRNVLYWHTHRMQIHREGDFCAYNAGFLANKDAVCFGYAKRGMKSKWANAFPIIHLDGDRHYVDMINCVDDSFVYNGVKYGKQ